MRRSHRRSSARFVLLGLPPKIKCGGDYYDVETSFGDSLRSKTEIAMKNELYCKLICHNLSCLIKAMYELGLGAEFLAASFQKDAAD